VNYQELLKKGQNALHIGELGLAEELIAELRDGHPDHPGVRILLGNILVKESKYNEAVREYQQAIELDAGSAEAYNNIGIVYRLIGNLEAATKAVESALEIAPDRADIHYNKGNIAKQRGDVDSAIAAYEAAIDIDSNLTQAYNNLGTLYQLKGDLDAAKRAFRLGLEKDANNPSLQYNLGLVAESEGDLEAAGQHYARALKVRPLWEDGLNNYGVVLQKLGRQDEAEQSFERILKKNPDNPRATNNLGVLYLQQGKADEAKDLLTKALETDPNYAQAAINLSQAEERTGGGEASLEVLKSLYAQNPDEFGVAARLTELFLDRGNVKEAGKVVTKLVADFPRNDAAKRLQGRWLAKIGKTLEAEISFQEAVKLGPVTVDNYVRFADFYRDTGKAEMAMGILSSCLEKIPGNREARLLLIQLYMGQNRYPQARVLLEELHAEFPEDETVLSELVQVLKSLGENELAAQHAHTLLSRSGDEELDDLVQALDLYESTVAEWSEDQAAVWERNLKALSDSHAAADEASGTQDEENLLLEEIPHLDDEAPILAVGGIDPVIFIQEEEEQLVLSEYEEELPEFTKEEEEEDPTKVEATNLGGGPGQGAGPMSPQAPYMPPIQAPAPSPAPGPGASPPATPAPAQPSTPAQPSAPAPAPGQSSAPAPSPASPPPQAMPQMPQMPQIIPMPIPMMPASAMPTADTELEPELEPDLEPEEEPAPEEEESVMDPELKEEEQVEPEPEPEPDTELLEEDEDPFADGDDSEEEEEVIDLSGDAEDAAPADGSEPELGPEELGSMPDAPSESEDGGPASEADAQAEPEADRKPYEDELRLFEYLENLTRHLPDTRRNAFMRSEMCLKMESLRLQMTEPDRGLRRRIDNTYDRRRHSVERRSGKRASVDKKSVQNTLSFLEGLSRHHPNTEVANALEVKVQHVIEVMKGGNEDA
jgi:Flp pilus assembly protein TadD